MKFTLLHTCTPKPVWPKFRYDGYLPCQEFLSTLEGVPFMTLYVDPNETYVFSLLYGKLRDKIIQRFCSNSNHSSARFIVPLCRRSPYTSHSYTVVTAVPVAQLKL